MKCKSLLTSLLSLLDQTNGESPHRVLTILLPGHEEERYCALLLNTTYGTGDAACTWQDTWRER